MGRRQPADVRLSGLCHGKQLPMKSLRLRPGTIGKHLGPLLSTTIAFLAIACSQEAPPIAPNASNAPNARRLPMQTEEAKSAALALLEQETQGTNETYSFESISE